MSTVVSESVQSSILTPAQNVWLRHRNFTRSIPLEDTYRGYAGLAFYVADANPDRWNCIRHDRMLVSNRSTWWVTMQDVPRGVLNRAFDARQKIDRDVVWTTICQADAGFGVPVIGANKDSYFCDFNVMPTTGAARKRNADVLDSGEYPTLFRTINAVNLAVTSAAVTTGNWQNRAESFCKTFGTDRPLINVAGEMFSKLPAPSAFAPELYVAFNKETADTLFDRIRRNPYTIEFKNFFCREMDTGKWMEITAPVTGLYVGQSEGSFDGMPIIKLHFRADDGTNRTVSVLRCSELKTADGPLVPGTRVVCGSNIGYEYSEKIRPLGYDYSDYRYRWDYLIPESIGPRYFNAFLKLFFLKNIHTVETDLRHIPYKLVSTVSVGSAVADAAYWNVYRALPYFSDEYDTFVLPPIRNSNWANTDLHAGDLKIDLALPPDRLC